MIRLTVRRSSRKDAITSNSEQGRHGVDDGGKANRDLGLTCKDEAEGQDVVQEPHAEVGKPSGKGTRQAMAEVPEQGQQGERRQEHAGQHDGSRVAAP